jgi:hypothetical protein
LQHSLIARFHAKKAGYPSGYIYGTEDVNGKNTPIMEVDCDNYKTPTYCSPNCPAVDI